jgi:hypothetical protein
MGLWSRVGARCPAFLLARFPDPLPEPDVRLPPHPALHEVLPVGQPMSVVACCGDHGVGMAVPRQRYRVTGTVRVSNSTVPSSWGHQPPRWRRICFQLERWYLRRSHPMTRRQV